MPKRGLIIGASDLQIPLIKKAKELGYETYVVDYDPKASGIKDADHFAQISTIDTPGILKYAQKIKPDLIVTAATDAPMQAISQVAEQMNLPSISVKTAILCTNKLEMMNRLKEKQVPLPEFLSVTSYKSLLEGYQSLKTKEQPKLILKPVDSSGSRGVILVDEMTDLQTAYNYAKAASKTGKMVLSELLTGPEVSVEAFVFRGTVEVITLTDKLTTGAPHFVELGHSQPSMLPEKIQNEIKKLAIQAINALGIEIGPVHAEIIVDNQTTPKIVEIGARLGGDYITSHLVPLSTGVDLLKATLDVAAGRQPNLTSTVKKGAAIKFITSNICSRNHSTVYTKKKNTFDRLYQKLEIANFQSVNSQSHTHLSQKSSDKQLIRTRKQNTSIPETSPTVEYPPYVIRYRNLLEAKETSGQENITSSNDRSGEIICIARTADTAKRRCEDFLAEY